MTNHPFGSTLVNPFHRLQDPDSASSTRGSLAEQLAPLHSTAEVAELQAAVASIPPGTPARAERLWKLLSFGKRTTIGGIQELLARLEAPFNNLAIAAMDGTRESGDTIILIPPVDACVVPGCRGHLSDTRRADWARHFGVVSRSTVYSECGILRGEVFAKTCVECDAVHHVSYAEGGKRLEAGKVLAYSDATDGQWFHGAAGHRWPRPLSRPVTVALREIRRYKRSRGPSDASLL